ncbi:MAG: stalk domain-containing protein [Actinobacteria bacterium]|nr:stalk domain-containing protein [Actinomycetota bacterium]
MKKLFIFISGVLVGAIIFGYTASFAKTGIQSVSAEYQNIKLVVEGKVVKTEMEPFLLNGRVYVPLRTVAEALGKKVGWENSTVLVGTGDQSLVLTDLIPANERGVKCSSGAAIAVNKTLYQKGFYVTGTDSKSGEVNFFLDQRGIKGISGKIGLDDTTADSVGPVDFKIYLDNEMVWEGTLKKGDPLIPVVFATAENSRVLSIKFNNSAGARIDFVDFVAAY